MEGFIVGVKEDKLGICGSDIYILMFNDVKVFKVNCIGEDGFGFKFVMKIFFGGCIGIAVQVLGIAVGVFELAAVYLKECKVFGKEIYKYQVIVFKIVDMVIEIEAVCLLVYCVVVDKDVGRNFD